MYKKSQSTVLIVLGIVIIVLIGIYSIASSFDSDLGGEQSQASEFETVKDPVAKYVTECLKKTSYDALQEMGQHGGFTNLERNNIEIDLASPTESDGVVLNPGFSNDAAASLFGIPYYWYMQSPDECTYDCRFLWGYPELYRADSEASIERELDKYVEEYLEECINDFADFEEVGYNIEVLGAPVVVTNVNDQTVTFTLSYPLEIKQAENEYVIEKYFASQDVALIPIYTLALELTGLQAEYRYLEAQLANLISVYAGVNNELPPIAAATFEFGNPGKIWVEVEVEQKMREILKKYTHSLRIVGTNNYRDIGETDLDKKILDYNMRVELQNSYDLDVHFNYFDWPIHFDMNCEGGICRAESWSNTLILLLGAQRYNFNYDVNHPVMVKIRDNNAFGGKGFDYIFALESNLQNNLPILPGDTRISLPVVGGSSLLCNDNQRNSGNYSFRIVDGINQSPVGDVTVTYSCGGESCLLGISNGTFNEPLPVCLGGKISLVKKDFMTTTIHATTALDEGKDLDALKLEPIRKRNITLVKEKFVKPLGETNASLWTHRGSEALKDEQEATVILKRKRGYGEDKFIQVVGLTGEKPIGEIDIVPGTYEVSVVMIDKNTNDIPEETREIEIIGSLVKEEYTMPGIKFNESSPWQLGGLSGEFLITADIDRSNTIELHVVAFEMGEVLPETERKIEDLQILGLVEYYTERYKHLLGFRYR